MDIFGDNKRVLVVDDDGDIRDILEANLTASGYEVKQAQDGVEAFELMDTWRPDLVVLDVSMPRMDGWEVANRARMDPKLSEIPVVFLTGKTDEVDVLRGLSLGAVEYATKPFVPENIMATVAMMVGIMDGQMREERRQERVNRLTPGRSVLSTEALDQASETGASGGWMAGSPDRSTRQPA